MIVKNDEIVYKNVQEAAEYNSGALGDGVSRDGGEGRDGISKSGESVESGRDREIPKVDLHRDQHRGQKVLQQYQV